MQSTTTTQEQYRFELDEQLASEDLALFKNIESQTTDNDKRSLLAIQSALRATIGEYRYLEIGSHLGGSIQPHLIDPKCLAITSIDERPSQQPDERGYDFAYVNNSTARMLESLRKIDADAVKKITTIASSTKSLDPRTIKDPPDLCLIDGEHTDAALKSDLKFCLNVLPPAGGLIICHDAQIVYNGIWECIDEMKRLGLSFQAYSLPDALFVVEVGSIKIHDHRQIRARLVNNYESYLYALRENDHYRRFANRPFFKFIRRYYAKLRSM
jgi:hypothetical protein